MSKRALLVLCVIAVCGWAFLSSRARTARALGHARAQATAGPLASPEPMSQPDRVETVPPSTSPPLVPMRDMPTFEPLGPMPTLAPAMGYTFDTPVPAQTWATRGPGEFMDFVAPA